MPTKKKKQPTQRAAAKKKRPLPVINAKYKCPADVPIPTGDCAKAHLPHDIGQLAAELEAYLRCLCAWQTKIAEVVNKCCGGGGGPDLVPKPPPPPF